MPQAPFKAIHKESQIQRKMMMMMKKKRKKEKKEREKIIIKRKKKKDRKERENRNSDVHCKMPISSDPQSFDGCRTLWQIFYTLTFNTFSKCGSNLILEGNCGDDGDIGESFNSQILSGATWENFFRPCTNIFILELKSLVFFRSSSFCFHSGGDFLSKIMCVN